MMSVKLTLLTAMLMSAVKVINMAAAVIIS